MGLLILGLLAWALLHLLPSAFRNLRGTLVQKLGLGAYKGLFALALIGALLAIVFGWRSITPEMLYIPPAWGRPVTLALMALSLVLFTASALPSRIKQVIRHPQLSAVVIWSLAHLLSNGEQRSLLLFGGMALWAIVSIACINRRDGAWQKPAVASTAQDLTMVVVSAISFELFIYLHPYLAGVALL